MSTEPKKPRYYDGRFQGDGFRVTLQNSLLKEAKRRGLMKRRTYITRSVSVIDGPNERQVKDARGICVTPGEGLVYVMLGLDLLKEPAYVTFQSRYIRRVVTWLGEEIDVRHAALVQSIIDEMCQTIEREQSHEVRQDTPGS